MIVVCVHFSSKADQLTKVIVEPILGTTGPHSRQRYSSYLNSSLAFTPAAPQKPVWPVCSLALCHTAWMHPVRVGVSLRPCPYRGQPCHTPYMVGECGLPVVKRPGWRLVVGPGGEGGQVCGKRSCHWNLLHSQEQQEIMLCLMSF